MQDGYFQCWKILLSRSSNLAVTSVIDNFHFGPQDEHYARWKQPIVGHRFMLVVLLGCSISDFPSSSFFDFDHVEQLLLVCQDVHSKMPALSFATERATPGFAAIVRDMSTFCIVWFVHINLDHMELDISIFVVVYIFPFLPR